MKVDGTGVRPSAVGAPMGDAAVRSFKRPSGL